MDEKIQKNLKKKLESEKKRLTKDLSFFAKKDPKIKGNWRLTELWIRLKAVNMVVVRVVRKRLSQSVLKLPRRQGFA